MTYYDSKKDKIISTTNPNYMSTQEVMDELIRNSKLRKHKRTTELTQELNKRFDILWGKS